VCVCVRVFVICIHVYVSQSLTPFLLTISGTYVWESRWVCGWVVLLLCVCVCACVCYVHTCKCKPEADAIPHNLRYI